MNKIDKNQFIQGFVARLEKVASPDLNKTEFVKGFLKKMAAVAFLPPGEVAALTEADIIRRSLPGAGFGALAGMMADDPSEAGKMGAAGGAIMNILRHMGTQKAEGWAGGRALGRAGKLALWGAVPGFFGGMLGHGLTKAPRYLPGVDPRSQYYR